MRPLALLALALLHSAAFPVDFSCFTPLAGLAAELNAESEQLMRSTFRQLWGELGLRHLGPEELKRLVAAEDPFLERETPPQLDTLKKHLGNYKRMIERKGWYGEATRTLLLEELRNLAAPHEAAEKSVAEAGGLNTLATWEAPVGNGFFSPDGHYFLSSDYDSRTYRTTLRLVDVKTGKAALVPWPNSWRPYGIHFSQDGKWLITQNHSTATLHVAPVAGGEIDFTKAFDVSFPRWKWFGGKAAGAVVNLVPLADSNQVYVTLSSSDRPYLVDLAKKTAAFSAEKRTSHFMGMGAIPGSSRIYFAVWGGEGEAVIKTAKVGATGKLEDVQELSRWAEGFDDGDPPRMAWSRDGQTGLATAGLSSALHVVDKAGTETFHCPQGPTKDPNYVVHAFFSADKKRVGVVSGNYTTGNRLHWYDRATKTWTPDPRGLTIPAGSNVAVNPAGDKLVFGAQNSPAKVLTLEPR